MSNVIFNAPGDGNCLFHSLAKGLERIGVEYFIVKEKKVQVTQEALRSLCSWLSLNCRKEKVMGEELQDWISMIGFKSVEDYAATVSRNGVWGGGLELAIISTFFSIKIEAYCKGEVIKFKPSSYDGVVKLQFTGNHYNLFE